MNKFKNITLVFLLCVQGLNLFFSFWIEDYFSVIIQKIWLVKAISLVSFMCLLVVVGYDLYRCKKQKKIYTNHQKEVLSLKAKMFDLEENLREVQIELKNTQNQSSQKS